MNFTALEEKVKSDSNYAPDKIKEAFDFAQTYHKNQKRKSGEPYTDHLLKTALRLINWQLDQTTVIAGILHDVIEDAGANFREIKDKFGEDVAFLVDGVSKISHIKYRGREAQIENIRKMILAMAQDIRVVLIKLADRLHNMETLNYLKPEKQKRIALETLEVYAPLAYRLGMGRVCAELEDLAFPYVYPKEYYWLKEQVKNRQIKGSKYLEKVKETLQKELEIHGVKPINIYSRTKHLYSLYKKLLRYDMDLDKIYDLVALRVIAADITQCYAALGVIHKLWPPLPGRIKDYIALPKPNGYQSLHTTVICRDGKITEFQIRTHQMDEESQFGITAAHWLYKETAKQKNMLHPQAKNLEWIRQLQTWHHTFPNNEEFIKSLKIDFFKDRIFVVTPLGEVIDLPDGSTPVDFAYRIHTDIGNQCSGARINGKIVSLDTALKSGDMVEILTQKNKKPSESWLKFTKTNFAKKQIKEQVRKKELKYKV